ncbi:hypothetical protein KY290_017164 [Solanum tuberosum]|uniref:Uncharacterized protein n=1 Tax=Solanum tuberosum TaxID=4113 RepID=A0ABQ7VCF7_SOLTU|nr:hypothetical protein KY284_016194 [Solanum tuberosum]KAH0701921.1 hypothetical protein KY285_016199 [Solanum tuberosum]KAH0761091.1 hypothetical protein KY290_017164 [Solanum tuberosum]
MEVQTKSSPLEPGCAESEANSHASTEVTNSAIDENEVQFHVSRTRGSLEHPTSCVEEQDVYLVYSLVKEFPCLISGGKLNLVESLGRRVKS